MQQLDKKELVSIVLGLSLDMNRRVISAFKEKRASVILSSLWGSKILIDT